jgi:uncharacterized repeat protein (TIGR01451 family)
LNLSALERCAVGMLVLVAGVMVSLAAFATGSSGAGGSDPADLSVTKTDRPDPVASDAVLTYTVEVRNAGPDPAENVTLTDDLAGGLELLTAAATAGTCERRGGRVVCELRTIARGGSETATIQVRVKKRKGTIENSASVSSDTADPDATNDSDTEETTIGAGTTCGRKTATVVGTPGNDDLAGTEGSDVIVADTGDDRVSAAGGKDVICGGDGNDVLNGGSGNDTAKGGSGNDRLTGKSGSDALKGNRGRDRLRGGAGNDLLAGGKSRDRCGGGSGRDTERGCER